MQRFRFPLERVRRWRAEQAAAEEAKLRQLAGQMAALADERARVENDRAESERVVLERAAVEAGDLQALDAFRSHVRARIGDIEKRRNETARKIGEQRERWRAAARQAELLERLKTKMFAEWRAEADREEETLASELYLARLARRR